MLDQKAVNKYININPVIQKTIPIEREVKADQFEHEFNWVYRCIMLQWDSVWTSMRNYKYSTQVGPTVILHLISVVKNHTAICVCLSCSKQNKVCHN